MKITQVALPLSWLGLGVNAPFPPPPIQFDLLGGGSTQEGGTKDSSIETFAADRHGCPTLSLKLGNTGFPSLADPSQNGCVHNQLVQCDHWPCGYCGGPKNGTRLSILYAESLSCGEPGLESWTQHVLRWVTGLWRVLCREPDSAFFMLSHWAVGSSMWGARLSIFYAESLSCVETCVESQAQQFLCVRVRLSCLYAESVSRVHSCPV